MIVIARDYNNININASHYKVELNFNSANKNGSPLNFPSDLNNQSITIFCPYCYHYVGIKLETGREAGTGVLYKPDPLYNDLYKDAQVYVVGIGSEPCTQEEVLGNIFKGIKAANEANGIRNQSSNNLTLAEHHAISFYKNEDTGQYSFLKTDLPMIIYNGGMGSLSGGGEEEAQSKPVAPYSEQPKTEDNAHSRMRRFEGNPIIIQYGPKQNQHLRILTICAPRLWGWKMWLLSQSKKLLRLWKNWMKLCNMLWMKWFEWEYIKRSFSTP